MKKALKISFAAYARKYLETACDADAYKHDPKAEEIRREATVGGLLELEKFTEAKA